MAMRVYTYLHAIVLRSYAWKGELGVCSVVIAASSRSSRLALVQPGAFTSAEPPFEAAPLTTFLRLGGDRRTYFREND